MSQRCANCFYARENDAVSVSCHRYPPTITKAEGPGVTTYFPLINNTGWCGEWRQAKGKAQPETVRTIRRTQ